MPAQRIAELYLYDTCTMKCGYCWLAESGKVLDAAQLQPFRDPRFISQIVDFFNSRTSSEESWHVILTGGEPLLMPNFSQFCDGLSAAGNRVSLYTALYLPESHTNFRFLLQRGPGQFDYIMASLHPEAEVNEDRYWEKIRLLKECGHKVFVRFVGHPGRLTRLDELSHRAQELNVCFYPTTLFSDRYPAQYTDAEKRKLASHFSSLSQFIQLAGGLASHKLRCHAGSRILAANLQTGDITPCISVTRPLLGNIFENRLELYIEPRSCPEAAINCNCDVHFQQKIVMGAEDDRFEILKGGFALQRNFEPELNRMRSAGVAFYGNPKAGIGGVQNDLRLIYTIGEVKDSFRRQNQPTSKPAIRRGDPIPPLFRFDRIELCEESVATQDGPILVTTSKQQWAYAVLFAKCDSSVTEEVVIRIAIEVLAGKVGVGIVGSDKTTYISAEEIVQAGVDWCDLLVKNAPQDCWLVFRNGDAGISTFRLHSIESFRAAA